MKNSDMKCAVKSIARKVDSGEYSVSTYSKGWHYSVTTGLPVHRYNLGVFDGDTLIATSTQFSATLFDARRQRVMVKWTYRLNQAMQHAVQRQEDYTRDLKRFNEQSIKHRLIEKHCL